MPIEFQCSSCHNVLKVAEEHAGKSARCPSCGAVVAIPLASQPANEEYDLASGPSEKIPPQPSNPFADESLSSSPVHKDTGDSFNPYQTPAAPKLQPRTTGNDNSLRPRAVDTDSVINEAWSLYKDHWAFLVGATLIIVLFSVVMAFANEAFQGVLQSNGIADEVRALAEFGYQLVSNLVNTFFGIGMIKICLNIARRRSVQFSELFSGADKLLPAFLMYIAFGVVVTIGLLLLIVPGIIAALTLWPYLYLIVDEKANAIQSMPMAYQIGRENKTTTFVMFMLCLGLSILGCLTCVGWILVAGFSSLLFSVAYLKMSGQLP